MASGPDPFDFGGPSRSPTPPAYGPSGGSGSADAFSGPSAPSGGAWTSSSAGASPGSGAQEPRPAAPADDLLGRPPITWLLLSLVLGVVGAVLAAALGSDVALAGVGWLLAGPLGIALLAVYNRVDVDQRARPVYDAPSWLGLLRWSSGVALAVGIAVSAWRIAEWAGRA